MSNEIAERTIESSYIIKVQNGHLNFIPRFAIFVRKGELYASAICSFKDWAKTNLLMNKLRQFVSLCERKVPLAV